MDRVTDNLEQHSMHDIPERKEESAGLGDIGKFTGLEAYSQKLQQKQNTFLISPSL